MTASILTMRYAATLLLCCCVIGCTDNVEDNSGNPAPNGGASSDSTVENTDSGEGQGAEQGQQTNNSDEVAGIDATVVPAQDTVYLPQGWSPATRKRFYFLSQGSQLVPYDWYVALEQVDSETLFNDPKHIESFRFIPAPADNDRNPDGLPIGFVIDDKNPSDDAVGPRAFVTIRRKLAGRGDSTKEAKYPRMDKWLGLTCAACHTNRMTYNGHSVIIDGAPTLADFQSFEESLAASLQSTTNNPSKMTRFAKEVLGSTYSVGEEKSLREQVLVFTEELLAEIKLNTTGPDRDKRYGFARLDAFGHILNKIGVVALGIPENKVPADAPVSYPFLWDVTRLNWVQWNGSASSPIGRNVGEVLGVFGSVDLTGDPITDLFKSSAEINGLHSLETMLQTLKAPEWPEDMFGNLKADRVEIGKALFAANCKGCHRLPQDTNLYFIKNPHPKGKDLIFTKQIRLDKIGTDQKAAMNFLKGRAKPGALKGLLMARIGPDGKVPAAALLKAAVSGVINRKIKEFRTSATFRMHQVEIIDDWNGNRPDKTPDENHLAGYKARPLNGIWATAPYLHNGSVPNLYQLLKPVEGRKEVFYVGSREFDPVNVGFDFSQAEGMFKFDTTIEGNFNGGHEGHLYTQTKDKVTGEWLNFEEDEILALIEYMKTLK